MMKTAVAMVVLVAMTSGCGGGGSSSGVPSQVQVSQLPALWSETVCDQNFKCASTADIMGRGSYLSGSSTFQLLASRTTRTLWRSPPPE
jgi:hypothetical protein